MGRETEKKLAEIERNFTQIDFQEIERMERNIDKNIVLLEDVGCLDDDIHEAITEVINEIAKDKKSSLKEKFMKMIAYLNIGNRRGFTFIYQSYDGRVKGEISGFF